MQSTQIFSQKTPRQMQLGKEVSKNFLTIIAKYAFRNRKIICLQQLSRFFYNDVKIPKWVHTVYGKPTMRYSQMVSRCTHALTEVVALPEISVVNNMLASRVIEPLTNFEVATHQLGLCWISNFILSNGDAFHGDRDSDSEFSYTTEVIQADVLNAIRAVHIHYYWDCICGFSFFDKDGELLAEIGDTRPMWDEETVILAENEVIVGVKTCPRGDTFCNFQFQIVAQWE